MWLLRRTTLLSSSSLRRSLFPPRQLPPPEKMNDGNSPGGNSVISFGTVSAVCKILNVESVPILSYDSFGKVVLFRSIGFAFRSGDSVKKKFSSLSDDTRFDEMRPKVDLGSEDACMSLNSKSVSEIENESSSAIPDQRSQFSGYSLPMEFGMKRKRHSCAEKRHSVTKNVKYAPVRKNLDFSGCVNRYEPFDICLDGENSALQASFRVRVMAAEDVVEFSNAGEVEEVAGPIVLRTGMVLLKSYVSLSEQVEIVKKCWKLGLGPGGFYQPVFQHGAKLCLQMMCLGLNWDPETRKYEDIRPIDGTRAPGIPNEFSLLVERAIQEACTHLNDNIRCSSVEDMLPSMTPNICITNFYTTSGRLGLHQDRDESKESLQEGLPVVSISIGDSADFLYGDQRDVEKAESVVLESGDVLIFGGLSRHIFHGVTSIIPNSAPNKLLEVTRLRPGRLNLTFRQY